MPDGPVPSRLLAVANLTVPMPATPQAEAIVWDARLYVACAAIIGILVHRSKLEKANTEAGQIELAASIRNTKTNLTKLMIGAKSMWEYIEEDLRMELVACCPTV